MVEPGNLVLARRADVAVVRPRISTAASAHAQPSGAPSAITVVLSAIGYHPPIRSQRVLPPVVEQAVGGACQAGHMVEPPEMVGAHIAATPLIGAHLAGRGAEIGEGVPGVGAARHRARVAPVVVG